MGWNPRIIFVWACRGRNTLSWLLQIGATKDRSWRSHRPQSHWCCQCISAPSRCKGVGICNMCLFYHTNWDVSLSNATATLQLHLLVLGRRSTCRHTALPGKNVAVEEFQSIALLPTSSGCSHRQQTPKKSSWGFCKAVQDVTTPISACSALSLHVQPQPPCSVQDFNSLEAPGGSGMAEERVLLLLLLLHQGWWHLPELQGNGRGQQHRKAPACL